jgi:hypothetical protein
MRPIDDRKTRPLTLGQRCALALLRGRDGWSTAKDVRVKDKTLYALARLGMATSRRRQDGKVEWAAALMMIEKEAA